MNAVRSAVIVGLAVAGPLLLAASAAHAQDSHACIAASESSLALRKAGKLIDARTALATCAAPACPDPVKSSCQQRLADADRAVPGVVFQVKDAAGNDVAAVRVMMDGQPLAQHSVGTAVALDPGEHTFTFEAAGLPAVKKTLVIVEGVKDRSEVIVLGSAAPTPATATPPPADQPPASPGSTQRTIGLIVGGVGIAGVAVGSIFGLVASSSWGRAQNECGPSSCTQLTQAVSDQKSASSSATLSTIAFVAGGVALAAGAVLWLTAPRGDRGAVSTAWGIAPSVGPAGGGVVLRGGF